jgi:malate dehydrogenase (oxaloacetate-decarboxylating)
MPIIYTPTEGDAIMAYSKLFRRPEVQIPRPIALTYRLAFSTLRMPTRQRTVSALGGTQKTSITLSSLTAKRSLVSVTKALKVSASHRPNCCLLSPSSLADCSVLMTLCAGINPNRTLPVILDVGTEVLLPILSQLMVERGIVEQQPLSRIEEEARDRQGIR